MTLDEPSFFTTAASSIAAPGNDGSREVDRCGTAFSVASSVCDRLRNNLPGAVAGISYWWTMGSGWPVIQMWICASARQDPPTM